MCNGYVMGVQWGGDGVVSSGFVYRDQLMGLSFHPTVFLTSYLGSLEGLVRVVKDV